MFELSGNAKKFNKPFFYRGLMTHASVPEKERKELKISDSLIRLSVGIESEVDIIEDIEQALVKAVSL